MLRIVKIASYGMLRKWLVDTESVPTFRALYVFQFFFAPRQSCLGGHRRTLCAVGSVFLPERILITHDYFAYECEDKTWEWSI